MHIDKNKEDISSKKTKSFHKPNKSDHSKPQNEKKQHTMIFVSNRNQQGRSQKTYSDKYSSHIEYKIEDERVNINQDIDGKTELNKQISNTKNKELQEELEREQLVREGLVNPDQKKIKISSRKRQIISQDILHPPTQIFSKVQKRQAKHQPNESQKIQQKEYEQIADHVRLNNLHSKVVNTPIIKKEETFLAKINESQSQVISSPLNNKKIGLSPQKTYRPQQVEQFKNDLMCIINEQGIKNSKEKQRPKEEVIGINPIQIQTQFQKVTQKKSNKITITTPTDVPKSNPNKLSLITATVEQKLKITVSQQQEENKKLQGEILMLKQAVRQLKLQKIKARAEFSATVDNIPYYQQKKGRYDTLQVSDQSSIKQSTPEVKFGRIRKNTSLPRKRVNSNKSKNELSLQRELDLPDQIINIKKFPQKVKFDSFLSERKPTSQERQYKTMQLDKIAEQNMQQSFKYQGSLVTSINMPVYDSTLRSNRINMRAPQICNQVLNKFQSNQKKFKEFVQLSSKIKTQSSRVDEFSRGSEASNESSFGGTIVKNNYVSKPSVKNELDELKNISLIRQGQKIILRKANRDFKVTSIPQIPQSPLHSTTTEDIMDMVLKILPYTNLQYSSKDLQDCILKKFKNSIMFQLKRFPTTKIVWYFNGKLYIGGWDDKKNQRAGFGKQFTKGKSYFEGFFKDNKKHGIGSFINETYLYEGEWINGQKKGQGKYLNPVEGTYYQGQWVKGKKEGKGHYEYQGNIYQGIFQCDIKMGFGIQIFKNGDRYIGTYENGKFQGEGKYIWFNKSFYLGHFHQGFRQGLGKWQSGSENYQLYVGEFHRDKKQGSGKYVWNNRCVYEGSFFNDLKHGLGSMLYPDGRYMEGIWTQGILTEILSKVAQANKEEPLDEPKCRTIQSRTIIRVVDR